MKKYGIMLNEDGDHFFHTRKHMMEQVDRAYLEKFIDQYANTDVTDFFMCIYGALTGYPSKHKTSYAEKYHHKTEMGKSVDYSGTVCEAFHILWEKKKLDIYAIWIDRLRQNGINPWLSYRMNDAHEHFDIPNHLMSDSFYEHLNDWAHIRHRRHIQYYDRCRDYEIEGVQNEFLLVLEESLNRYDPYGIELDFQREFDCYQIGHERSGAEVMTAFLEKIKKIVEHAEKRYGHKIQIAARCHANPLYCMELGFDIIKWAELGLIDMYIPSPRWYSTDNDMPIALWKQILKPYHVALAGGIDMNIASKSQFRGEEWVPPKTQTVSTTLGTAAGILSQGADKVYLFNYMDMPDQMYTDAEAFDPEAETLERTDLPGAFLAGDGCYRVLSTAGDMEKIHNTYRRHIVTVSEKNPPWRGDESQLPLFVSGPDFPGFVKVITGDILSTSKVILKLGLTEAFAPEKMEIYANSCSVAYIGTEKAVAPILTDYPIYTFEIPTEAILSDVQIIEFISNGAPFTVDYVEIAVMPVSE